MYYILFVLFMLSLFIFKYFSNESYFKNKYHDKYLTKNKRLREFFLFFSTNNDKNKIIERFYYVEKCELSKDLPKPRDFDNFPIHKSSLKLKEKTTDKLIGSINGMPWFWGDRPIFLVDDLWVDTLYRRKGLGEYLIMNLATLLLPFNGLGIFTTHRLLESVKENHILSVVYWYKPNSISKIHSIRDNYKEIDFSEVDIADYIFEQPLFNIDKRYIKMYLELFCKKKGKIYTSDKTVLGIYHKDDINSDFHQLAWYWGSLEDDFDSKYECMIPSLNKHDNENAWDRACTYIYGSLNSNEKIELRDKDIYGWFLPR